METRKEKKERLRKEKSQSQTKQSEYVRPRVLNGGDPLTSQVMNKYLNYFKQLLNFKNQDLVSTY